MSFSPTSCNPTCSSTMTIATIASTPVGTYTITVTGTAGSVVKTTSFTLTVVAPLPTVTITAPDSSASETAPNPGTFRISRTNSTTALLAVSYIRTGTASVSDYTPTLTGTLTIPAGQSSADIIITPVDDTLVEPTETVILTLAPSATYTIGTPSAATVSILDNDVAFNFSLTNGGAKIVTQGQQVTNPITATLASGTSQPVTFSAASSPALIGGTMTFSPTSCNPTCSSTMTIATIASTPVGMYTITVTGTAGALTKTTSFTLTVNALPLLTMTVGPNLSWTSLYTSSCTASGGWSGSKPLSGSEPIPLVTTTQSFVLTCVGPGGSVARTVRVSVE